MPEARLKIALYILVYSDNFEHLFKKGLGDLFEYLKNYYHRVSVESAPLGPSYTTEPEKRRRVFVSTLPEVGITSEIHQQIEWAIRESFTPIDGVDPVIFWP